MLDAPKTRIALLCFGAGRLATLLPFIPTNEWWIRAFDFPGVLIATVLGVLFAAFLLVYRRERALDSVFPLLRGACAIIYQGVRIAPYTPLLGVSVAPSESCGDDGFRPAATSSRTLPPRKNPRKPRRPSARRVMARIDESQWCAS